MLDGSQLRIIDLPGALAQVRESSRPFEQSEVTFEEPRTDEAFLKEIVGNRALSEGFMAARGMIASWSLAELILRAYVEPVKWKGAPDQFRSSLGIPILAENFYSSLSAFTQTLFAGNRPFLIDPGASTALETARAQEILLSAQLKVGGPKGTSVKQEIRALAYDAMLYGTGVGIAGWETRKIKRIITRRKNSTQSISLNAEGSTVDVQGSEDDIERVTEVTEINHSVFEHIPLRRVRVAPDCRRGDVRSASWRGRIIYLDSYQLNSLRGVEGYNIPSKDDLVKLTTPFKVDPTTQNVLETPAVGTLTNAAPIQRIPVGLSKANPESSADQNNVDPLAKKFEIFEYITDTRIGWVLENQYIIRNQNHDGDVAMFSFNFREAPDSFFGYGMGLFCTDFQRMAQGIANSFFDDVALKLLGTYTQDSSVNIPTQPLWMFPGQVARKGIEPMERTPAVDVNALGIVETIKMWAANITGAGASIQGVNPGRPGDMRTKQGVEVLSGGDAMKLQDLVDQFCENVYVPLLEFFIENNKKLKPSQVRQMLTQASFKTDDDTLEKAFKSEPIDILNGYYKVTISAGAKLQARQALNNALGYIQSILQQPGLSEQLNVAGIKFDWVSIIRGVMESFGLPYTEQWVVPMNDEDKQRLAAQQNQIPQQLQAELIKIQAQTDGKKQIDENQGEIRALLKTQEHTFKTMIEAATGNGSR